MSDPARSAPNDAPSNDESNSNSFVVQIHPSRVIRTGPPVILR